MRTSTKALPGLPPGQRPAGRRPPRFPSTTGGTPLSSATSAIRGSFFDFRDDPWKYGDREQEAARFTRDGLMVVKDGLIADFGPFAEVAERHPGVQFTHLKDRLILPGFIDGHIHF